MKLHLLATLLCGAALCAAGASAQTASGGRIGARAQPPAPAPTTAIASPVAPGGPSASGLASPFPPSVTPVSVPGTSAAGSTVPGTATATTPPADIASDLPSGDTPPAYTAVMGAGAYGTRGMIAGGYRGPVTAVDVARSFLLADANRDGELTRAEATRLTIAPLSFEEMDANHDDRLTRSEYETVVRP